MKKSIQKLFAIFVVFSMFVFTSTEMILANEEVDNTVQTQVEEVVSQPIEQAEPIQENVSEEQEQSEPIQEEVEETYSEQAVMYLAQNNVSLLSDETTTTYDVFFEFEEVLTDVTVTLTGTQTYQVSASSVAAYDGVTIPNVEPGQYTITVTAKNAANEDVKGSSTIYQGSFDYAEDNTVYATISNLVKDVNGQVTTGFVFNNPHPAKDGLKYSFDSNNVTAKLVAADGTEYPLTVTSDGYVTATVPANQPYKLVASGWSYGRVDGANEDTSVKYSFTNITASLPASYFAQSRKFPVNVPESKITVEDLTTDTYPITIIVKDSDTKDVAANASVAVTDPDGNEYSATTDEKGQVSFELPTPGIKDTFYSVTAKDDNARSETMTFTYDTLKAGTTEFVIWLPKTESFNATVNVFVNGECISTKDVPSLDKNPNIGSVVSGLSYEGVATCTKVEAFREDGTSISIKLLDTPNNASAEVDKDAKQNLENNETITVNFYYEYTDADTEYSMSIKHIFRDDKGNEVYRETQELTFKAGEEVAVDQLRTNEENWVQKDIPGYRVGVGAWFVSGTMIMGGNDNPLVGSVTDRTRSRAVAPTTISFTMPHAGVDAEIYYTYKDNFVEYVANNDKATGSMYIDWSGMNEVKGVKANKYALQHYHFVSWNTQADGRGVTYNPGDTVTVEQNITLYAQWEIDTYTVTWLNDDGKQLEVDKNVEYGTMPSYDGKAPTKASDSQYSYTFKGWTPEISEVTGDVTYTAVYTKKAIPKKETEKKTPSKGVPTGVESEFGLWASFMIASGSALGFTKKRKHKK